MWVQVVGETARPIAAEFRIVRDALMLAVPAKIPELTYIFFCALEFNPTGGFPPPVPLL
jgi:hypothetical protein